MSLRYCFEQDFVARTLASSKPHDLAVIDTEGHELSVKEAVKRGVFVYGYLNAGALEKERPYYQQFKYLRLALYDGWDGEYWIDPTDRDWQQHLISEAKQMKRMGVIGLGECKSIRSVRIRKQSKYKSVRGVSECYCF